MKKMKKLARTLTVTLACLISFGNVVPTFAAASYKDVPTTHWAYSSITAIADKGYMVGDTAGNYKPNDPVDKFEMSKVLAKAAGYKYTGVTETEKIYYDRAYEKNKNLLASFDKQFSKWSSLADREIAYLIEKEILTVDDLNQFVIKDSASAEKLRALSKEETAIYLVRLIGKEDEALEGTYTYNFKDDSSISAAGKPYVYFLKTKSIVAGDTDGKFNPKTAVNRATLAVMMDKSMELVANDTTTNATPAFTNTDVANVSKIESISGKIDKIYTNTPLNAIQIVSADNQKKIYKLSTQVTIYVDSYLKTSSDLKEGMTVIGVANNDELVDIKASSVIVQNEIPANTTAALPEVTNNLMSTPTDTTSIQSAVVEGVVTDLDALTKTVSVEIRMLNPKGEITTDVRKFIVSNDSKVLRGEITVAFDNIVVGDVVKVETVGTAVKSLNLEEKNRSITGGTLLEKKYIETTLTPILVIQDANDKKYDLRVTDQTSVDRRGSGIVTWSDLRIGDTVDAVAEYDKLVEIHAYGTFSNIEGWIEEIKIGKNDSYIGLKQTDKSETMTYRLITGTVDVYSLRVGDKVNLRLDSKEVQMVSTITQADMDNVTGYIQRVKTDAIVLNNSGTYNTTKDIRYDNYTVVTDSRTGNKVNVSSLYEGMKIYVVFTNNDSGLAKTITILSQ